MLRLTESLLANSSFDFVAMTLKSQTAKMNPRSYPKTGLKSKNRAKLLVTELKCVRGQKQIRRVFYTEHP